MTFSRTLGTWSAWLLMATVAPMASAQSPIAVPDPPRDFRGVWVATVENIDWPSRRTLSVEQQQQEMLAILDGAVAANLNAIVLQVRPTCDAIYPSELEPWSLYLTGQQGKAPEPFYDPLEFTITEAHKRGIQVHTWLNPYRAHKIAAGTTETLSPGHVTRAKPHIVREYGRHLWLDPTHPEALAHNVEVFQDLVRRYNVDGIHMDDYFYPYPEQDKDGNDIEFPDHEQWELYQAAGGAMSRGDWRRSKVNELVQVLNKAVKDIRPTVQYGISPFGIWRPGHPQGIAGFDQYDKLYADAKLWLNEGWVDYFTPQLYWRIRDLQQSFPVLLKWWMSENTKDRHIWPGLFTSRVNDGTPRAFNVDEIINQIVLTRFLGATGNIHFSWRPLRDNRDNINDRLTTTTSVYPTAALPPPTPWLDNEAPPAPIELTASKLSDDAVGITWTTAGTPETNEQHQVFTWAIQSRINGRWQFSVQGGPKLERQFNAESGIPDVVAVAAVDRLGNISPWTIVETGTAQTASPETQERFGQVQ